MPPVDSLVVRVGYPLERGVVTSHPSQWTCRVRWPNGQEEEIDKGAIAMAGYMRGYQYPTHRADGKVPAHRPMWESYEDRTGD
jgi:hypothetical protein